MIIWGKIKIASFPLHMKALSAGYLIRPHKYTSAENCVNRWKSQEKGGLMSGQRPHSVFRAGLSTHASALIWPSSSCSGPGQGSAQKPRSRSQTPSRGLVLQGVKILGFKCAHVDCNKRFLRWAQRLGAVWEQGLSIHLCKWRGKLSAWHSTRNPLPVNPVEYIQHL